MSEARRLRDEGKLKEGGQKLLEKIEKRLTKIYNLRVWSSAKECKSCSDLEKS